MHQPEQNIDNDSSEPIHVYTRTQAIADGILIDATEQAREAGFRVPVALTAEAWTDCVAWNTADSERQSMQDESGRLWDVLWTAARAARHAGGAQRLAFQFYRVPRGGRGVRPRLITLNLCIGPGDDAMPVITIFMPGED